MLTEKRLNELKDMWSVIEEAMTSVATTKRCGTEVWTPEQIDEERIKWYAYEEWKEQKRRDEVAERLRQMQKADGSIKTQIITICIDQNIKESEAIDIQNEVIDKIRGNYKWLVDAKAVYEYYSKDKELNIPKWNPHIHIYIEKTIKGSTIAQQLRRKFVKKKEVYRINVKDGKGNMQLDYINGTKTDEKKECVEKDKNFREINKITEIIDI